MRFNFALIELTCGLMLSSQSNVSQNPGFESFTGNFIDVVNAV